MEEVEERLKIPETQAIAQREERQKVMEEIYRKMGWYIDPEEEGHFYASEEIPKKF